MKVKNKKFIILLLVVTTLSSLGFSLGFYSRKFFPMEYYNWLRVYDNTNNKLYHKEVFNISNTSPLENLNNNNYDLLLKKDCVNLKRYKLLYAIVYISGKEDIITNVCLIEEEKSPNDKRFLICKNTKSEVSSILKPRLYESTIDSLKCFYTHTQSVKKALDIAINEAVADATPWID